MNSRQLGTVSENDVAKLNLIYDQHQYDGDIKRRYGIVIVLDVLGWKSKATPAIIKTYVELINTLRTEILRQWLYVDDNVKDEDVYVVTMSDSICIFLDINDHYCELNIFKTISEFIVNALGCSLAFRGAISRGEYYINKTHNVFIGEAIYEAFKYAEKTEWAGIILTDSIAKSLLENNSVEELKEINIVSYDNIPYKEDQSIKPCYKNLVLIPKKLIPLSSRNIFMDLIDLYQKVLCSEKEDVKKKLENTKKFFEYLIENKI